VDGANIHFGEAAIDEQSSIACSPTVWDENADEEWRVLRWLQPEYARVLLSSNMSTIKELSKPMNEPRQVEMWMQVDG
jgi:hypothetical protein